MNFKIATLLVVSLATTSCCAALDPQDLSLKSFPAVLSCRLGISQLKVVEAYNGYGCWCGRGGGGGGKPVDDIDQCCKVHGECYDKLAAGACGNSSWLSTDYTWSCQQGQPKCQSEGETKTLLRPSNPSGIPYDHCASPGERCYPPDMTAANTVCGIKLNTAEGAPFTATTASTEATTSQTVIASTGQIINISNGCGYFDKLVCTNPKKDPLGSCAAGRCACDTAFATCVAQHPVPGQQKPCSACGQCQEELRRLQQCLGV